MNVMDIINVAAWQHWRLETDADGIAWATLDKLGETTNSLSVAVMDELAKILAQFESAPPKALIFRSGKAAGFIAGADIQEFTQLDTPAKGLELISRGWNLFNRLAAARYPTLAIVRGHWGIENQQHWVLDVQFGEDACRTRKDHSAENLALIRRIALNVLRHNGPPRDSIRRRKLRAALNDEYRLRLLLGQPSPATT